MPCRFLSTSVAGATIALKLWSSAPKSQDVPSATARSSLRSFRSLPCPPKAGQRRASPWVPAGPVAILAARAPVPWTTWTNANLLRPIEVTGETLVPCPPHGGKFSARSSSSTIGQFGLGGRNYGSPAHSTRFRPITGSGLGPGRFRPAVHATGHGDEPEFWRRRHRRHTPPDAYGRRPRRPHGVEQGRVPHRLDFRERRTGDAEPDGADVSSAIRADALCVSCSSLLTLDSRLGIHPLYLVALG